MTSCDVIKGQIKLFLLLVTLCVLLVSPGGILEIYMTGGSDGASFFEPKKILKLEIYTQINTNRIG